MELLSIKNKNAEPGEVLIDIAIGIIAGIISLGFLGLIYSCLFFLSTFINDTFPKI